MIMLLEISVLIFFGWKLGNCLIKPMSYLTSSLLAFVIAIIISSVAFSLFDFLFNEMDKPILIKLSINILISLSIFFFCQHYSKKYLSEKFSNFKPNKAQIKYIQLCRFFLITFWLFVAWLFIFIFVNMLSMLPNWKGDLKNRSFYTHAFIDKSLHTPSSIANDAVNAENNIQKKLDDDTLKNYQNKLFQGINSGLKKSKDYLAEVSGSRAFLNNIAIVKELSNLSPEKKIWLAQNNKELKAINNNKKLQAIMSDDVLMNTIFEASQGSVSAIAQLMTEPQLEDLLHDKKFHENIKKLDLSNLRDQVHKKFPAKK